MLRTIYLLYLSLICLLGTSQFSYADSRQRVEFPAMMRDHMLTNMRDHLAAVNEILEHLGHEDLESAADIAETRLGFSALHVHGADHMAQFMPEGMRTAGTAMHRAASQFARVAQEGELLPAYRKLQEITASCVACHNGYKVH